MREGPASGHLRPAAADSSEITAAPSAEGMRSSELNATGSPFYIARFRRSDLSFAEPLLRIAAEVADQFLELVGRRGEPLPVGAAQHQRHAEIAAAEIGVGADLDIGKTLLQPGEIFGQSAFGQVAADAAAQHLVAADKAVLQLLE